MRPANLDGPGRAALRDQILERLGAMPDVTSVASVGSVPFVTNWYRFVHFESNEGRKRVAARFNRVGPGFFATISTPVIAGRDFNAAIDTTGSPRVAVVNQAFVQKHLDGTAPIGLEFRPDGQTAGVPGDTAYRIVGVVGNTKHGSLREPFDPMVYVSESQVAEPGAFVNIFIRPTVAGAAIAPRVRSTLAEVNSAVAYHFHDVGRTRLDSIAQDRLMALLCGAFAVLGGVLAIVGVYGVMAYSLSRRRSEIGVRLALGAGRLAIIRMAVGEAAIVIAGGVAAGTAIALAVRGVAASQLFGLTPGDPATFAAAIGLLFIVGLGAAYLPASRASKTDPTVALRHE
jgi:putative ABC transport system permease protein